MVIATALFSSADVAAIRTGFPILADRMNGQPIVDLHSGATAQKPLAVLDAEREFLVHRNAAGHRVACAVAAEATEEVEDARATVAACIGANADEIVVTEREHHANLIPGQQPAQRTAAVLRYLPVDDGGTVGVDFLDQIAPVTELVARARQAGALVVLDAGQSVPHLPFDVWALDVDFAAFSGHTLDGPTSVGVLYGRCERLAGVTDAAVFFRGAR